MSLDRNTLLSRLGVLARGSKGRVEKKQPKEKNTATSAPANRTDRANPANPANPEKSLPMQREILPLPEDHPVYSLWNLYQKSEGADRTAPSLSLIPFPYAPGEPVTDADLVELMPPDEAAQDQIRWEEGIVGVAERRLAQVKAAPSATNTSPPTLPAIDAMVQVFLTTHQMTAWLFVFAPINGGAEVDLQMLKKSLETANVRYGRNETLLAELPKFPDRYFHPYVVALGKAPVHGKDGYVIDLFSRVPKRTLTEDASGRVDYASLDLFQNVKKGDTICRIVPPQPAQEGRTVLNVSVPARAGQTANVPKGRNTELSEDGTSLIASCEGHVAFSGRSFQVKPVLDIGGNVDFSTGNINSLGDIHIHGDVCSGFTVRTVGSITVDGVVEACTIEAGGDLVVRKGVQGNNRAVLRAHRNIFAKYLESSSVYVRENLETECIVNCNVYSDGAVTVRSGRGAIIGGSIHATREISAHIIGARSECQTRIALGGHPCEEFEQEGVVRETQEMEEALEKLEHQPDSPAKLRQMSKLRLQISANKLKLRQFKKELENFANDPATGRMVCGIVYPGTEIAIGEASLRVTHETQNCTASLVRNEVILF